MDRYVIPSIFGKDIGIIVEGKNGIQFQYNNDFEGNALPVSPILMPYDKERVYTVHDAMAFNGLPGIFNDSLPDRFGAILMNHYFSNKYGSASRLSVLDKLLYIGSYGMGAIEYNPAMDDINPDGIALRKYINDTRKVLEGKSEDVIGMLMQHPSPGGARPKAAVMWDRKNNTMSVSNAPEKTKSHREAWIVKFDEEKREDTLIECCYMNIANSAGIDVPPIEIISMGNENHFAIKRFDRADNGDKLHMATLSGLLNLDFNIHVSTSYETCMKTSFTLTQDYRSLKELFRRMVFNVVGRNCDDHSKNTSFLMNKNGEWQLSPAYDLLYNYGKATFGQHRMSISGKIDNIKIKDLAQCGYSAGLEECFMKETIEEISDLFSGIVAKLSDYGVSAKIAKEIEQNICQFSVTNFPDNLTKNSRSRSRAEKRNSGTDELTKNILKKAAASKESRDCLDALVITGDNQKLITDALLNKDIEISNIGQVNKDNSNFKIVEYELVIKEGLIITIGEKGKLYFDEKIKRSDLSIENPKKTIIENIGEIVAYSIKQLKIQSILEQDKESQATYTEKIMKMKPTL